MNELQFTISAIVGDWGLFPNKHYAKRRGIVCVSIGVVYTDALLAQFVPSIIYSAMTEIINSCLNWLISEE